MGKLYGLGDSVMEGYGNNMVGVLDTLHTNYGYQIIKDASKSGALLQPSKETPATTICTIQKDAILSAMKQYGVDKDTIVVMDGGGNDAKFIDSYISSGTSTELSIDKIIWYTGMTLDALLKQMNGKGKVFFLIPNIQNPWFNETDSRRIINFTFVARQTQTINDMANRGVIGINLNEILNYKTDMKDMVHPNASGYKKIAAEINKKI